MWLSRISALLCLPIPCRRAATMPRPGNGSQMLAGIPSLRNLSLSIRAAAISLPGGLLVLIFMYFESRSVASCVILSQSIGLGGGAFDTPIDSDGRMLGVADGAAKAEPGREQRRPPSMPPQPRPAPAGAKWHSRMRGSSWAVVVAFDHALKELRRERAVNCSVGESAKCGEGEITLLNVKPTVGFTLPGQG